MAEINLIASKEGLAALAACAHIGRDGEEPPEDISETAWEEAASLIRALDGCVEQAELSDARNYLKRAIATYAGDPPDSDFQRGHLAALEEALAFLDRNPG